MKRLRLGLFLTLAALTVTAGIAAAAGLRPATHDAAISRLAFSQGNNLWLANADGSGRHVFATGKTSGTYSWYAWSPDGTYLLVSKNIPNASSSDLLLYDSTGAKLRTLVRHAPWSGFYASWASNADEVAYGDGTCAAKRLAASACSHLSDQTVYSVDVNGRKRFIGSYTSLGGGCGGGMMDPAGDLYRIETDFGINMPTLHWAVGKPLSFLGVMGYVPQPASKTPAPGDIAVSATGVTAGIIQRCSGSGCVAYVVLLDPYSGRVLHTIGRGELPAWSPDGKTLYFVRRTAVKTLAFHDSMNNAMPSQVYTSAIWRADSDGTHPAKVLSERAYGFGPLTVTPDGRSIVFSRVGNDTRLWAHRLPGNSFNDRLVKAYGPTVRVQQVDLGTGTVTTVASNAGRPAIEK